MHGTRTAASTSCQALAFDRVEIIHWITVWEHVMPSPVAIVAHLGHFVESWAEIFQDCTRFSTSSQVAVLSFCARSSVVEDPMLAKALNNRSPSVRKLNC